MKKVIIYSTPTCPYCKMAKEFLKENNIEYTDYDVVADEKKAEEMIEKSGQMSVPVIIIKDGDKEEMMLGFDQEKLGELMGIKK